jgi:hypothetical protein
MRTRWSSCEPEVLRADDLALAHRDAAVELPEVFAEGDLVDQLLGLAELSLRLQPLGPALHLAQRLDIGGDPGEPVRRGLVRVERGAETLPSTVTRGADSARRALQQRFGRRKGLGRQARRPSRTGDPSSWVQSDRRAA